MTAHTTVDRSTVDTAVNTAGQAPTSRRRLVGMDATRGVALLGMMAVHSLYDSDPAGHPTWSFTLFAGRAAAAFAVLAGVGIAFMTGRRRVALRDAAPTVAALVVRALVIGAIGLAMGYTDSEIATVILPYYAVMFVLVIPLVFLPTWAVAAVAATVAGAAGALIHLVLPHLSAPSIGNPTVLDVVQRPGVLFEELMFTGEYPALPWMAYLAAGLVVGRLTLTRLRVVVAVLLTGTVLAVGAAVISSTLLNQFGGLAHIWAAQPGSGVTAEQTASLLAFGDDGTVPTSTWWWLAVDGPHTSTPPDLVGTIGTALAILGAMLLAEHVTHPVIRRVLAVFQFPLAAAGSMTLTFYVLHVAFINSDWDVFDAGTGYRLQVVAVLLLGLAWRATAGRGPLEALVTALSAGARRCATRAVRGGPSTADPVDHARRRASSESQVIRTQWSDGPA
jgi:uncharacterized membrane protein